mmetsp:Transcript_15438/g.39077  ORF Transcript_15438/g.39077 Transcript_15438/m.39077 type:complete len:275 (-) Transcript_15438:83-907(-)
MSPVRPGTIGFLGAGQMAEAMARGFVKAGLCKPEDITAYDPWEVRRQVFEEFGAKAVTTNGEVVRASETVFVSVKPNYVSTVLEETSGDLSPDQLIVSIAAGVPLEKIEAAACKSSKVPCVRVMPNTPCLVGAAACAYAAGKHASEANGKRVEELFGAIGVIRKVPENLLDAVTGLSGSGPAYVYLAIEAMADGGVAAGLPRDVALPLAAQTVMGAAKMVLETGQHPGALKDNVCSPGGTTIAGVRALEKNGVRSAFIEGVNAAADRAREMSRM